MDTLDQVLPEVARAIYSINKNEITQPIRTSSGYFILELTDKKETVSTNAVEKQQLLANWQSIVKYFLAQIQLGRK